MAKKSAANVPANLSGIRSGAVRFSRRNFAPALYLYVDGQPANDLLRQCVSFNYKKAVDKAAETKFVFRNDDRKLLDDPRTFLNVTWRFRFGFFYDMSPIIEAAVREVAPVYEDKRIVTITLYDSSLGLGLQSSAQNWGVKRSSDIARELAAKHGMQFDGTPSEDKPTKAFVQPGNVSDMQFLRDLAAMIDYEVYVDGSPPTLYYKPKDYSQGPAGTLTYYDDPTDTAYVKSFKPKVKGLGPISSGVASSDGDKKTKENHGKDAALANKETPFYQFYVDKHDKTQVTRRNDQGGPGGAAALAAAAAKNALMRGAPSGSDVRLLADANRRQMLDSCNEASSDHPLTPSITTGSVYEWRGIEKQLAGKWYCTEVTCSITGSSASTSVDWKRNTTGGGGGVDANAKNNKDSADAKEPKHLVLFTLEGDKTKTYNTTKFSMEHRSWNPWG